MPNPAASAQLHCKIRHAWLSASGNFSSLFKSSSKSSARQLSSYFHASSGREQAHSYLNVLSMIKESEDVFSIALLTPAAWHHGAGGNPAAWGGWKSCSPLFSSHSLGAPIHLQPRVLLCAHCKVTSAFVSAGTSAAVQEFSTEVKFQLLCSSFGKLRVADSCAV